MSLGQSLGVSPCVPALCGPKDWTFSCWLISRRTDARIPKTCCRPLWLYIARHRSTASTRERAAAMATAAAATLTSWLLLLLRAMQPVECFLGGTHSALTATM